MDAPQFALWLQGFAELNAEPPTKEQWQSIREHLQLVFTKVTPEVKARSPTIDVTGNEELRRLIDGERKKQAYWPTPQPIVPYQPYYLGDDIGRGTSIC